MINFNGPPNPEFEANKFEVGDVIIPTIESEEEFVEIIGNAFYDNCRGSFPEDASVLIKLASRALFKKPFKVQHYTPAYVGEVHRVEVSLAEDALTLEEFLADPEMARLQEEFESVYKTGGTGILFFLRTEIIKVDAADFVKSNQ